MSIHIYEHGSYDLILHISSTNMNLSQLKTRHCAMKATLSIPVLQSNLAKKISCYTMRIDQWQIVDESTWILNTVVILSHTSWRNNMSPIINISACWLKTLTSGRLLHQWLKLVINPVNCASSNVEVSCYFVQCQILWYTILQRISTL